MKITGHEHSSSNGKDYERLSLTVQFDSYRPVTILISMKDGAPWGAYGWKRLEAIADAVGISKGDEYDFDALMNSPFRVELEKAGNFLNPVGFAKLTSNDRDELADHEAREKLQREQGAL